MSNIEEAIKQLEDLKRDRLSFVTGDKEHDEIYLKDVQAIEIVLGNLKALVDMQKTADRELENARRINEEHKKENGELREKVKKLEETIADYQRMYCRTMNDGISKQKIKELKENIHNIMDKNGMTRAYQIVIDEQFKELLQESEDNND